VSDSAKDESSGACHGPRKRDGKYWTRYAFDLKHHARISEYFSNVTQEVLAERLMQMSDEQRQQMLRNALVLSREVQRLRAGAQQVYSKIPHEPAQQAERVRLARPPRLAFAGFFRMVLKPAAYKRYVEPAIADMHEEYFACLARGDERGAKLAVIKGNLYAIPGWAWAVLAQVVLKLIEWIRA
jgi:hypothetical protein